MGRLRKRFFYFAAALAALTSAGSAQIRSGSIVGKVMDPTSAPIPAAAVIVFANDTNAQFEMLTNSSGDYAVPYLPSGRYTVTVRAEGFVASRVTDLNLGTAQTVRVDLKLELGAVATSVEVAATAGELQTESATVQNVVTERFIQGVPNITHNPFYYAAVQAGVVPRSTFNDTQNIRSFGIGQDARRQFSAISVNGGQAFTNDVVLDGVSVQSATFNEATVVPNPEGVQEVRTLVNNYSAEFGRGQGVITVTTKSGTNAFHGSTFYRIRNEALNANSFANNARGLARPPFKVHTYGGTFGGPIRKDKVFFFVSYEGLSHRRAIDYFATVPTPQERRGDFSQTLINVSGRAVPLKLFDPFSVQQVEPNVYRRQPIPNAIIPRPDPFVLKMFSYYPVPNRTPDDVFNKNNYFLRGAQQFSRNSLNSRIDYRWQRHSFYGTGGLFEGGIDTDKSWGRDNPFHGGIETFAGGTGLYVRDRNPYAAIGDTIVLSPTLVADFRYGVNRVKGFNELPRTQGFDYDQFGIPRDIQAINPTPGNPPASGWGGSWNALHTTTPHQRQYATNHHLVGSMTKTLNKWTLKFGGEYRAYLSNYFSGKVGISYASSANFTREMINAAGAGIGSVTPDVAGYGPASFLLGAGSLEVPVGSSLVTPTFVHKYGAIYMQNDWRATSRLTVNLGLRWDVQPGATDRFNNFCSFDEGGTNPYGTRGALACAGTNGYSRNIWDTQWKNFGPRGGLAYRLTNTFVVRAGYGLMYLPTNTGYRNSPFVWGMDSFQPFTNSDPFGPTPNGSLIGRFNQVNRIVPAIGADVTRPENYGGARQQRFTRHFPTQNVQQWNLFLEKRLKSAWLISAGYSAAKGSNLLFARLPINNAQLLPQSLLASWRQDYIARNGRSDPGSEQIPNPLQPAAGPLLPFNGNQGRATLSRAEALFPFPHFAGTEVQRTIGWSNYHSLVVQVNRQFANGLLVNFHYTWSKAGDFTETELIANDFFDTGQLIRDGGNGFDLTNWRNNYAPSYFDVPHRAVIAYIYELPFGVGKPFRIANSVAKAIISGWRTGGVATFQSGTPIQISGASDGSMNGRPDRIPGVAAEVPKELQRWYDGKTTVTLPSGRQMTPCNFCFLKYNSDAFQGRVVTTPGGAVVNDIYWFGNSALRGSDFRSPGINNWNMSVERTFKPNERFTIEFSAHFTNAFNHTQFRPRIEWRLGATNTTVNSPQKTLPGQGLSGNFGTYDMSTFDPRQVELQLKLRF